MEGLEGCDDEWDVFKSLGVETDSKIGIPSFYYFS